MAQLVVRNLDEALKQRLRSVAAEHGRSMEEEVRVILHTSLSARPSTDEAQGHIGLGYRIHDLFAGVDTPDEFFEALEEIRHGNDASSRAVDFGD